MPRMTQSELLDSQVKAMTGFVQMARNPRYKAAERHSYLTYAFMHACQGAIYGDEAMPHSMKLHDYKHAIRECIERVMSGEPLNQALKELKDFQP